MLALALFATVKATAGTGPGRKAVCLASFQCQRRKVSRNGFGINLLADTRCLIWLRWRICGSPIEQFYEDVKDEVASIIFKGLAGRACIAIWTWWWSLAPSSCFRRWGMRFRPILEQNQLFLLLSRSVFHLAIDRWWSSFSRMSFCGSLKQNNSKYFATAKHQFKPIYFWYHRNRDGNLNCFDLFSTTPLLYHNYFSFPKSLSSDILLSIPKKNESLFGLASCCLNILCMYYKY